MAKAHAPSGAHKPGAATSSAAWRSTDSFSRYCDRSQEGMVGAPSRLERNREKSEKSGRNRGGEIGARRDILRISVGPPRGTAGLAGCLRKKNAARKRGLTTLSHNPYPRTRREQFCGGQSGLSPFSRFLIPHSAYHGLMIWKNDASSIEIRTQGNLADGRPALDEIVADGAQQRLEGDRPVEFATGTERSVPFRCSPLISLDRKAAKTTGSRQAVPLSNLNFSSQPTRVSAISRI